jgi:hypothetical protein
MESDATKGRYLDKCEAAELLDIADGARGE